jgi:hypothetical protein
MLRGSPPGWWPILGKFFVRVEWPFPAKRAGRLVSKAADRCQITATLPLSVGLLVEMVDLAGVFASTFARGQRRRLGGNGSCPRAPIEVFRKIKERGSRRIVP